MEAVRPDWTKGEVPLTEASKSIAQEEPEPAAEKPQALSYAEGMLAAKALEKQPEVAFGRSARAAELDEPLEGQLERKEVREKPELQQAASIRSIIEQIPSRQQKEKNDNNPMSNLTKTDQDSASSKPASLFSNKSSLYKQAITGGFIAALMTIVFLILLNALI